MTADVIIGRIRRILLLDAAAFEEVRDDASFTPVSVGAAVVAVLLAAIGAWLYGETVLDFTPDGWFVDTVVLGTLFTVLLFLAGMGVIYVLLTQAYRYEIAPDALVRVLAMTHLPFALGLLIFLPEIGFGFGVLSVAAMFYYTIYGIRAAIPNSDPLSVMISVAAGFAVWAMVIPLISDPGDNFVTGVFVYGLIA